MASRHHRRQSPVSAHARSLGYDPDTREVVYAPMRLGKTARKRGLRNVIAKIMRERGVDREAAVLIAQDRRSV